MKTDREIIEAACGFLEIRQPDGSVDGRDFETVQTHYDAFLAEMDEIYELGLGFVADQIPDWAEMGMAMIAAGRSAHFYGFRDKAGLEIVGLRKLRSFAANEVKTNQRPTALYY